MTDELFEQKLLKKAKSRLKGASLDAFNNLFEFAKSDASKLKFGYAVEYYYVSVLFAQISRKSLFTLRSDGMLALNLGWLNDSGKTIQFRKELLKRLYESGFPVDPAEDFDLKLEHPKWVPKIDEFISITRDLIAQIDDLEIEPAAITPAGKSPVVETEANSQFDPTQEKKEKKDSLETDETRKRPSPADLPSVPYGIVTSYVPSGKYPAPLVIIFILLGLPGSMVIGAVVLPVAAVIAVFLLSFLLRLNLILMLIAIPTAIAIIVAVPLTVGTLVGEYNWLLCKLGKGRNKTLGGLFAAINGFIGLLALPLLNLVLQLTRLLNSNDSSYLSEWWAYLIYFGCAVVSAIVGWRLVKSRINDLPFCEEHDKWYKISPTMFVHTDAVGEIMKILDNQAPGELELDWVSKNTFPHLEVQIYTCPAGSDDFWKVSIAKVRQKKDIEKGKETVKTESVTWFEGMVPGNIGSRIMKLCRLKDNDRD